MNPPEDLKIKISDLEKFVEQGNSDAEGLIHCLNSLSQVVADICRRLSQQRDELQGFILKLGMYLEDIDIGLQKSGSLYNELHQQNMRTDKAVQDELRAIQEALQTDADRDVVTEKIRKHLESVDFQLQQFRDMDNDHYQHGQQILAMLGDKVESLISDSASLRNQLEGSDKRAMHDALTGMPNRSAFEERLALEVARCKRYGMDLSLAVFNVDKFKAINENYGRAAGDRVLKVVAEILTSRTRETDFSARYEDAEFVVLMPETSQESAQQVAEKICGHTEQTAFQFHEIQVDVTIAAGVSQYKRDELVSALLDRADAALDQARKTGGNRAACAAEVVPPGAGKQS
jgi:diguanylate cyclase